MRGIWIGGEIKKRERKKGDEEMGRYGGGEKEERVKKKKTGVRKGRSDMSDVYMRN